MTFDPEWPPAGSGTRQHLVDAAAGLREALTVQLDAPPAGWSAPAWSQVGERYDTARKRFEQARGALPRQDRLARRLADQWQEVATARFRTGHLGLQTTEDVAWTFLGQLATDDCPRWATRHVYRSARGVPPGDWLIDGWKDLPKDVALWLTVLPRFTWAMARLGWRDAGLRRRG